MDLIFFSVIIYIKEEAKAFENFLRESGLDDTDPVDIFYISLLRNWRARFGFNYLDPTVIKMNEEKVNEFKFCNYINDFNFKFKIKPNVYDPYDYDFLIFNSHRCINFCDGKLQTNTLHFKNIWDITALNFLTINEAQLQRYGKANDLGYILIDRNVQVSENRKVLPYINGLNWMINELDFNDSRELVLVEFKKLYESYKINEHTIRRKIPLSKNPIHNHPDKRWTVCFSSEAPFCKRYKII